MFKLAKNKYLCICLAFVLVCSLFLTPIQYVHATGVEETQETMANVETPTEPVSEGAAATEPTVIADEDEIIVNETDPTEGSQKGDIPSWLDDLRGNKDDKPTDPTDPTDPTVPSEPVETQPTEPAPTEPVVEETEPTIPEETEKPTDTTEPVKEEVEEDTEQEEPAEPEIILESVDYEVVLTTKILASDVFYVNGAPTFIYKIEQIAEDGSVAKYWYKSITIEKEYTELMTDEEGYVSVETTLTLPSGIYRVMSEQTGRYDVDQKVQDITLEFVEIVVEPETEEVAKDEAVEGDENIESEETVEIVQEENQEELKSGKKEIVFTFTKSEAKNLPLSSCSTSSTVAEYVGLSLKANKGTFDADTVIQNGDFTLLLIKADGTTEEVDMSGMTLDFYTSTGVFPNMSRYPDINGDIKVSVSYAFNGIAYYTDTTINLYQKPYILYLETELKVGKEDNGNADHYIVTAVYSDGMRQLLLPSEIKTKDSMIINSNNIDQSITYNFPGASYLEIKFSDGAKTSGVNEVLIINDNMLHSELNNMNLAADTINVEWNGGSEWTMTITPVYIEKEASEVPTYVMQYVNGSWQGVLR